MMMQLIQEIQLLLSDYTFGVIAIGTFLLGAVSGLVGSFALLKRQSLLADAVSHASLPGIVLMFLVLGVKEMEWLLLGALISGAIGAFLIKSITETTHLKQDTALGIVLSVFFGFGMLLLTFVQKLPNANQAGLEKFLFGQAATLLKSDVYFLSVFSVLIVFVIVLFWKEFKLVVFDKEFAVVSGFPAQRIDFVISLLVVIVSILGLQTVGVILISALLIAPAAAARQWTDRLEVMVVLAAFFGGLSGLLGTVLSALVGNLSTGPVIVLSAAVLVFISFVFSPHRGLLFRQIRYFQNRSTLEENKTLSFMYNIAKDHPDFQHPHAIMLLNDFKGYRKSTLKKLEKQSLIQIDHTNWWLTEKGFEYAENLYNQYQNTIA